MILHEKLCNCNPENFKACTSGCVYLEMEKVTLYFENGYDPYEGSRYLEQEKEVFKCSKFDKLMYPFSIERKNLPDKYPGTFENQEPMPKQCDGFSDNYPEAPWNF